MFRFLFRSRRQERMEEETLRLLEELRQVIGLVRQLGMVWMMHGGKGGSDWGAIIQGLIDAGTKRDGD